MSSGFSQKTLRDIIIWVLPTLTVPLLRYRSETRPNRRFLLLRDLFSYSLGAASFFLGARYTRRLLKKTGPDRKELLAAGVGTVASILVSTQGVMKLSNWADSKLESPRQDSFIKGFQPAKPINAVFAFRQPPPGRLNRPPLASNSFGKRPKNRYIPKVLASRALNPLSGSGRI